MRFGPFLENGLSGSSKQLWETTLDDIDDKQAIF